MIRPEGCALETDITDKFRAGYKAKNEYFKIDDECSAEEASIILARWNKKHYQAMLHSDGIYYGFHLFVEGEDEEYTPPPAPAPGCKYRMHFGEDV